MKLSLTHEQLQMLRETNIVGSNEIAYIMGDLLVIENVQGKSGSEIAGVALMAAQLAGAEKQLPMST